MFRFRYAVLQQFRLFAEARPGHTDRVDSEAHMARPANPAPGVFATTHWSVVLLAKTGGSSSAAEALGQLCQTYWRPIYAFLRRQGNSPEDAEDLTQAFFVHLMRRDFLNHLQHQQGRFRSFLLAFLKHFLADERDKTRALKRGGGELPISLDALDPEARDAAEPADYLTPENAYERHWARAVLDRTWRQLRDEYAAEGKLSLFGHLKDFQPGEHGPVTYAEIGRLTGLSESGVKSAVHRMRRRHREILRQGIAQTVARPEEIEDEIRHLIEVIGQ
jgi:RNA polymerase sigma-70 factor (ECF subfamily)